MAYIIFVKTCLSFCSMLGNINLSVPEYVYARAALEILSSRVSEGSCPPSDELVTFCREAVEDEFNLLSRRARWQKFVSAFVTAAKAFVKAHAVALLNTVLAGRLEFIDSRTVCRDHVLPGEVPHCQGAPGGAMPGAALSPI